MWALRAWGEHVSPPPGLGSPRARGQWLGPGLVASPGVDPLRRLAALLPAAWGWGETRPGPPSPCLIQDVRPGAAPSPVQGQARRHRWYAASLRRPRTGFGTHLG